MNCHDVWNGYFFIFSFFASIYFEGYTSEDLSLIISPPRSSVDKKAQDREIFSSFNFYFSYLKKQKSNNDDESIQFHILPTLSRSPHFGHSYSYGQSSTIHRRSIGQLPWSSSFLLSSFIASSSSSFLQQNPSSSLIHHRPSNIDDSKQAAFHDDDNDDDDEATSSNSDEKYINDSPHQWSDLASKHYPKKIVRTSDGAAGDSRLWAIPYRFGKRSAMPYRFGKRAGMHFRLGKKSASL